MQRHLVQKEPESAEGQGHLGAGNSYVCVPGFQETHPKFCQDCVGAVKSQVTSSLCNEMIKKKSKISKEFSFFRPPTVCD